MTGLYNRNYFEVEVKRLNTKRQLPLSIIMRDLNDLKLITNLHDIGKVAIPERILKKPSELTDEEWEIIKGHPESGYRIIKSIPKLASIADTVLSHQEHWDGSGYPRGLKGKEIPYLACIIAIIDAYDIMTHDRPYRKAITSEKALLY